MKRVAALLIITLMGCAACGAKDPLPSATEQAAVSESAAPVVVNTPSVEVAVTEEPVVETPTPVVYPSASVESVAVLSADFNDGVSAFKPRGGVTVTVEESGGREESACLKVSGRTATWNGALVDLSDSMTDGKHFSLTAWVKYDEGNASLPISAKLEKNGSEYLNFAETTAKKGVWTQLTGDIVIPPGTEKACLYFETQWKTEFTMEDLCDLYIDDVTVTEEVVTLADADVPALKDIYKDYFYIGTGIEPADLEIPEIKNIVLKQFDTITGGNQMKPDSLLDRAATLANGDEETPAVSFDKADILMDFAVANNLKVRGHVLVWYQQTPRWFFTAGYSSDAGVALVDRDTMLKRLENYIKQVLEHFQTQYPGVIFAWDVVNEAIEPGDLQKDGLRVKNNLWYETIGPDYVEKAFEYARKYADPDVKLFYNDYNTYNAARTMAMCDLLNRLLEKNLVDGMGMQSHIKMDAPSPLIYENTIRAFCSLGVEVHVTELDLPLTSDNADSLQKQGERYGQITAVLRKLSGEGLPVTSLTIWGVTDDRSWLNTNGPAYPLLFDKYFCPKPAFWGVAGSLS